MSIHLELGNTYDTLNGETVVLEASNAEDPVADAFEYIEGNFGSIKNVNESSEIVRALGDDLTYVSPILDEETGIYWLLVVIAPWDDFLGDVEFQQQISMLFSALLYHDWG